MVWSKEPKKKTHKTLSSDTTCRCLVLLDLLHFYAGGIWLRTIVRRHDVWVNGFCMCTLRLACIYEFFL